MKQNLLYLFLLCVIFNINAQENIVSFSTENGTHTLTTDKMFSHYFQMPSTNYDLREVGVNLNAATTSTNAVIRFAIYDLTTTDLLWQSGDVAIVGGSEEYVSVTIPANTLTLEMNKTYRVALLGDPNGGTISINAFPNPVNEGVATQIEGVTFVYYNGKTNYPNFPSQIEGYGSTDTINWYRTVSVVVKGDADVLSIDDRNLVNELSVFPNPATDKVNIKLNSNVILNHVTFYNVLGQTVKSSKNSTIDITDLKEGTYLIEIHTDKGKKIKKLIVN